MRALASLADETVGTRRGRPAQRPQWWFRQNAAETLAEIPCVVWTTCWLPSSYFRPFAADSALNHAGGDTKAPPVDRRACALARKGTYAGLGSRQSPA